MIVYGVFYMSLGDPSPVLVNLHATQELANSEATRQEKNLGRKLYEWESFDVEPLAVHGEPAHESD